MNTKLILEELKFICWVLLFMQVYSTSPDFTLLALLEDSMVGLDMIEILICKLIFLNYHLLKLFKLFGMEPQFLLEDLLHKKFNNNTNCQLKLFWIKGKKLFWVQLALLKFWSAPLFVPIWVVYLFHISELIMDGSAFVMVQFTTNLVELDKVLLFKIFLISTIQFMKMEHYSASKLLNSQENLQLPIIPDVDINTKYSLKLVNLLEIFKHIL